MTDMSALSYGALVTAGPMCDGDTLQIGMPAEGHRRSGAGQDHVGSV